MKRIKGTDCAIQQDGDVWMCFHKGILFAFADSEDEAELLCQIYTPL